MQIIIFLLVIILNCKDLLASERSLSTELELGLRSDYGFVAFRQSYFIFKPIALNVGVGLDPIGTLVGAGLRVLTPNSCFDFKVCDAVMYVNMAYSQNVKRETVYHSEKSDSDFTIVYPKANLTSIGVGVTKFFKNGILLNFQAGYRFIDYQGQVEFKNEPITEDVSEFVEDSLKGGEQLVLSLGYAL